MAVYLDYNASAPIDERVLERMVEVYRSHYGNADSRTHIFGTDAKEIVSSGRKTIAEILAVDSMDVFFTSGSTESNNMAVLGLLDYALESGRNHFITTSIEHKSVLEAMKHLQEKGCVVDFVSPDTSGRIKPEQILSLVSNKTLLVSMMHVNSETGVIQPIEEVGAALEGTKAYFHVDATQGFGKLGLDKIYVQAKRYAPTNRVGSKEIQAFSGAMKKVRKGVFITTSSFTKEALKEVHDQVDKQIALIDGSMLTDLMLRYGVGIRNVQTFEIYEIDCFCGEDKTSPSSVRMITASLFSTRRIFFSRHPLSSTTRIPFPGIRIQTSNSLPKTSRFQ